MGGLPEDLEQVAKRFRRFAEIEARGYCRFYEELCLRIAQDEHVLRLAANVFRGDVLAPFPLVA